MAGRSSQAGVGAPSGTRMMRAAVAATGATEGRTMQSGQWSASDSRAWVCATWTTASRASRMRQRAAAAMTTLGLAKRDLRRAGWNLRRIETPHPEDTLNSMQNGPFLVTEGGRGRGTGGRARTD